MITPLLLALQRSASRMPAPVRRIGRLLLARKKPVEPLVGWDRPILGGDRSLTWPEPAAPDPATARERAPTRPEMRCLLVTESLDAGGMDEFVAFLARGLAPLGIETAVLIAPVSVRRGWGPIAESLSEEGCPVWTDSSESRDAVDRIRRWAPDVIAVHGDASWPLRVSRRLGVPAVLVLHGMHDLFGVDEESLLDRYRQVDLVVCVSDLVRQQYLARSARIDPERVVTVPNGVDADRARGVPRRAARAALGLNDEHLFVSLSRHALQKNTYGLVGAFGEVADRCPGAHLLICGRDDDEDYTRQVRGLAQRMRHGDRVHLRQNTLRPDVLLAAADAFVLDSFFEGWALASMEALAAGVPVVLSEVGGAAEQLAGGPPRGMLVQNPLGDPLAVDWLSMAQARFRPQGNRRELVDAMTGLATGVAERADAKTIADFAADAFRADECLRGHAAALQRVIR